MTEWTDVTLDEVRGALKKKFEVYEEIAYWVNEKGWRVRGAGHKYALYPPDPGFRMIPPFVRVDGTPRSDATWQARTVRRECIKLEKRIADGGL